jgi:predicted O-linked N-acetylglucosamine transferase (SPINDLY family)
MPTKYLNGRFTFGMYKKMGFIDLVADSPQTYVKLAVKTATDKAWRQTIIEKINKNKHLLFQEKASIQDWSNLLSELYEKQNNN